MNHKFMAGTLFLHFERASITKYISFHQNRIPRDQVIAIINEIDTVGNINQDTLGCWKDLISEHNRIIERGERMMLMQCIKTRMSWAKFQSLDLFMLQMQSRYLARPVDEFSCFGERVLRLIHDLPTSLLWNLGGEIVVERTSWCRLCGQMMTLLHVLGCLGMADPTSARLRLRPGSRNAGGFREAGSQIVRSLCWRRLCSALHTRAPPGKLASRSCGGGGGGEASQAPAGGALTSRRCRRGRRGRARRRGRTGVPCRVGGRGGVQLSPCSGHARPRA